MVSKTVSGVVGRLEGFSGNGASMVFSCSKMGEVGNWMGEANGAKPSGKLNPLLV